MAEAEQLAKIDELVRTGRYRSASDLVREALAEKLERIRREELAAQVAAFCEAGHAEEDADLIAAQAFAGVRRHAKR